MAIYLFQNAAKNTTAAPVKVATGATIKTMLQVKMGATIGGELIEVGYSFDAAAAAVPGQIEIIEVDVAATVTAFVLSDITKVDAMALMNGDPTTAMFEVGTSASGFTSSNEGTPTVVRNLAAPQLVAPTSEVIYQIPLGNNPFIQPAKFFRIRMTFPATVNAYCYAIIRV